MRYGSSGDRAPICARSSGCSVSAASSASARPALGGAAAACTVRARPTLMVAFSSARSAWSAWIAAASLVTWAVTVGLPSRSAPTQLPNRRHAGATGAGPALAPGTVRQAASSAR